MQENVLSTGCRDLDQILGGLEKGKVYVIAARPKMGKTSLALNLINNMAIKERKKAYYVSLEMNTDTINKKLIDIISKSSNTDKNNALAQLKTADIKIDDTSDNDIETIYNQLVSDSSSKSDVIIFDYLQLIHSGSYEDIEITREEEVGFIMESISKLAKELEVPVIVLSQLGRLLEDREDKRPILADLSNEKVITDKADTIMFLYREDH